MTTLEIGQSAPDFDVDCYEAGQQRKVSLASLRGQKFILAFYPKDSTPGCTKEMCAFRDDFESFQQAGIQVFGVSKDSLNSHEKFTAKHALKTPLLSDQDGTMCDAYGVGGLFPKRTLFLIDEQGIIRHIVQGMPKNEQLLSL